jgi:hypothetical protein
VGYNQPAKGESFSPRDHPEWVGKLFVIYPTDFGTVQFEDGPSDIVTADVIIADLIDPETQRPKVLQGARIGGKALVPAIKGYVGTGDAALGRLRQLPAKGAKSGAYVLDEHTDAEIALATQVEAANANWRGTYAQPAATPTGAVSAAPATATPAPAAAAAGAPWFGTDTALLTKLLQNGVANATTLDYATAQLIGASFA